MSKMNYYDNKVTLINPDEYYSVIFKLENSMDKLRFKSCDNCYSSWVEDQDNCKCTCYEYKYIMFEFEEARDANQLLDKTKLLRGLQEERTKILFNPNRIAKLINDHGFEILDTLE